MILGYVANVLELLGVLVSIGLLGLFMGTAPAAGRDLERSSRDVQFIVWQ